ncbi:MAG: phosphotriesterase [Atopobiaceae bacterium]|nr:phosphotriesterase [Atopobiaceae bacterium]
MADKIVRTVLGDIVPEQLGYTSMHDHTVADMSQSGEYMQMMFSDRDPETLAFVPENYVGIKDGSYLANPELWVTGTVDDMVREFGFFKALGGQSVFDPSPVGIRGPIRDIQELSRKTGLNIVVATGFYHETTIPPEHMDQGEDHFYAVMKDEIENGIESTEVKPGAIKCAFSYLEDNELDAVHAGMRLAAETGMCIHFHTEPTTPADDLLDELEASVEKYGVNRERVVVCHMDNRICAGVVPSDYFEDESVDRTLDLELQRELLGRGYNIGLDTWGLPLLNPSFFMPDLFERTKALCLLCADGYASQITLGNDFSGKICMRAHGEWGPTAAFAFGCQRLLELGHDDWVHTLTVETPARLLAF